MNKLLSVRKIFERSQDGETGKCVKKLREIYDNIEDKETFFEKFVLYLQLPLTFREKTEYVDHVLEMCCRFASSFLQSSTTEGSADQPTEAKDKSVNEEDDDDSHELPPFLCKLFNWLLDHHEV